MKRALDLALALALLVPVTLVCALIALLVLAVERKRPLLVQRRLGRHERPFGMLKLRTMRLGTAVAGTHEVSPSAITPFGRIMRRLKFDELPQVWNVLVGEMSFVGPRPGLPEQGELTEARRPLGVYAVRPGITGLAQVTGVDMSTPERLALIDAVYVERRTLALDLSLLARTAAGRGWGDRVRSESEADAAGTAVPAEPVTRPSAPR